MRKTLILFAALSLTAALDVAAAELPKYDAAVLAAYAANPKSFESNHEQILKVVRAQSTKLYSDMSEEYMRELKLTESPVSLKILQDFLAYFETLPTSILADQAYARQNVVLGTGLIASVALYQVMHKMKVTILHPPDMPSTSPIKTTPEGVSSAPSTHTPADATKIAALEDRLNELSRKSERDQKIQYALIGAAVLAILLALVAIGRR